MITKRNLALPDFRGNILTCNSHHRITPGLLAYRPFCVHRRTVAGQAGRLSNTATMRKQKLSNDELKVVAKEWLNYNPETGKFTWKIKRPWTNVAIGSIAGENSTARGGYFFIKLCRGRSTSLHRLAFVFMTGDWPSQYVDHINGIKNDNRWVNLRPATPSQNNQNMRRSKRNRSGFKGVKYRPEKRKWEASIDKDRKSYYLGLFKTPQEASEAVNKKRQELHGEFAKYF